MLPQPALVVWLHDEVLDRESEAYRYVRVSSYCRCFSVSRTELQLGDWQPGFEETNAKREVTYIKALVRPFLNH